MMGQADTKHTLSEARRMGGYIVSMLLLAGGDVLYAMSGDFRKRGEAIL
jgi:hypothetical protein